MTVDLNRLEIPTDCMSGGQRLVDPGGRFSVDASNGEFVEVYFRDIRSKLLQHINAADYVFGSVAWLTCPDLLRALSLSRGCSMVVQKEDFLRPDSHAMWDIKRRYGCIPGVSRYAFDGLVRQLSVCCDHDVEAIRCLGNHNSDKSPSFPRAHNKFAVFCRLTREFNVLDDGSEQVERWRPYAVWTGSFNWTKTAGNSLENAVFIKSDSVADAYYQEFQQLLALSEPLDWSSKWVEPEWRIGT